MPTGQDDAAEQEAEAIEVALRELEALAAEWIERQRQRLHSVSTKRWLK